MKGKKRIKWRKIMERNKKIENESGIGKSKGKMGNQLPDSPGNEGDGMKGKKRIMLYLPPDIYEELAQLHTEQGGRMNNIIVKAIQIGLMYQTAQEAAQKGEAK